MSEKYYLQSNGLYVKTNNNYTYIGFVLMGDAHEVSLNGGEIDNVIDALTAIRDEKAAAVRLAQDTKRMAAL